LCWCHELKVNHLEVIVWHVCKVDTTNVA
jgi:hypothetical protein